ncbi:PPE family protein [Mycobacterium sp. TY815]|uniref:PPE family protein n=1 Tax=Mycobacterium sp. TY815 TaxID=3050581 RepID=UPI0027419867|nr:PPE family protein [Mycobacterium sp. TY815]MDP7705009.1 PPE domain-containing protein [Mycobacterium sp. TY815]
MIINPAWIATPPEVHSTLLSTGPGPGSLLAAASAWHALSVECWSAAAELSALLGVVQAGVWEGPTAAQYAAAHGPFLAWLSDTGVRSSGIAAQHGTVGAAYSSALAAMPTLAELAANHGTHAALLATNFFGINTIPIAINEADYVRMWIQAATTMTVYQSVSTAALVAITPAPPAPTIGSAEAAHSPPTDPVEELLAWSEHFSSMYRALKGLLSDPFGTVVQLITDFATSPSTAVVTWLPLIYVFAYAATFALMGTPLYTAFAAATGAIPLALGLSALYQVAEVPVEVLAELPVTAAEQAIVPIAAIAPTAVTAGAPPGPTSPGASTAPSAPTPTSTPGATGTFAYLIAGPGPGSDFDPVLREKAVASAPAAAVPAASSAAALSRSATKARRRRRSDLKERGYRDEYLTLDDIPDVPTEHERSVTASNTAAGTVGFADAAIKVNARDATGLAVVAGDSYGSGPSVPMTPGTWGAESSDSASGT